MSARRELHALWEHWDELRQRLGLPGAVPPSEAGRLLDAACSELGGAHRRLASAGMLTPVASRALDDALAGLVAARDGRLAPATAIARYGLGLQEVAADFHISLAPTLAGAFTARRPPGGNGASVAETPPAVRPAVVVAGHAPSMRGGSEVVETLAFVTSVAAEGGHRLGGFSASGSGDGYRLTARCAGCGGLVSVHRDAGAWSFSPVIRCTAP